jgi:hypothetical protein
MNTRSSSSQKIVVTLISVFLVFVVSFGFWYNYTYHPTVNKKEEIESPVLESDGKFVYWTECSTVKIRPFDSPGDEQSIHIKAAKNEYEAFQVAVTAPEGLTTVKASVSHLTSGDDIISRENIRLYREAYLEVVKTSNTEGEVGPWPDTLIPDRDPYFNETRYAFPFDVPAGQNRVIWVDVFVTPTTCAGTYTGNLTITASGRTPAKIPINLTVWNFTLPSTASLTSAFGFDGWELLVGHYGDHEPYDRILPLSKLYAESGLMHRISLESVTSEDWSIFPSPPTTPINWTEFDVNWGPFVEGVDLPYGLRGARLTSMNLNEWGESDEERVVYWRRFADHFEEKGWIDILFDYTWDEPDEDGDFSELRRRANLIHEADPDLRVMVTTPIQLGSRYDLTGVIDVWVPVINEMHGKPDSDFEGNQRGLYDGVLEAGDELWWYQSCMSHGCYERGEDEHSIGWPSYMVDIPAVYNRIMEWQSFRYNISGELYFSTNYAYEFNDFSGNDPWKNLNYFGGNGDGTLFYPGRPEKIGGIHHIPVESIRLKMIREGMEDYEYMKMLLDLGDESFARSQIDSVVTNAYTFNIDPNSLFSAREKMAQRITQLHAARKQ